jgi:hypothetical protein
MSCEIIDAVGFCSASYTPAGKRPRVIINFIFITNGWTDAFAVFHHKHYRVFCR